MTTLQEQFEKDFSKKAQSIRAMNKYHASNFTNYDLDLSGYRNLEWLELAGNKITHIKLIQCKRLERLLLNDNNLTSLDFLNIISDPENLKWLLVSDNNIQSTDISIFSRFVNLEELKIGTAKGSLEKGKHNKFFGSFKSWKNLTKLRSVCIEATDVNEGLEYLPTSLAQSTANEKRTGVRSSGYTHIECSPHSTNAKCSQIQDQLRPLNYDLEAWQLANKAIRLKDNELLESKQKLITELQAKLQEAEKELRTVKEQEVGKTKKISRLESKVQELEKVKKEMVDKSTQTETSKETIIELLQQLEIKK